jgi:hypothetical protein
VKKQIFFLRGGGQRHSRVLRIFDDSDMVRAITIHIITCYVTNHIYVYLINNFEP